MTGWKGKGYKEKKEILEEFQDEGLTQAEIGEKFNLTPKTISHWEAKLGLSREHRQKIPQEDIPSIVKNVEENGWGSQTKIAEEYGVTQSSISSLVTNYDKNKEKLTDNKYKNYWINKIFFKQENTKSYVYIFRMDRFIKIGRSEFPIERLRIYAHLPWEDELIGLIHTDNSNKLESILHENFSDKRMDGEWFELTQSDINYIKNLNIKEELYDRT